MPSLHLNHVVPSCMLVNKIMYQAIDHAPEDAQERAVYYCNAAACYLKQQAWQLAVEQCTQALKLNNSYLKVLLHIPTSLKDSQRLHQNVQKHFDAVAQTCFKQTVGFGACLPTSCCMPALHRRQQWCDACCCHGCCGTTCCLRVVWDGCRRW